MAHKDASKKLGGMSGKAASALRGRGAALKAAEEEEAMGSKAKKKTPKLDKSKKTRGKY